MEEEEKDFVGWINSIEFVDKKGKIILSVLQKDNSEDPENDRGEEE